VWGGGGGGGGGGGRIDYPFDLNLSTGLKYRDITIEIHPEGGKKGKGRGRRARNSRIPISV